MAVSTTTTYVTILRASLLYFLLPLSPSFTNCCVHDLLVYHGLPPGIFPSQVKSYTLSPEGLLEVFLDVPSYCTSKYENMFQYESVIRANLSYGELSGVQGIRQEELFIWLTLETVRNDDPKSGLIMFDFGIARKEIELSLFEVPRNCEPQFKHVCSLILPIGAGIFSKFVNICALGHL